jgi:hypothetical protein
MDKTGGGTNMFVVMEGRKGAKWGKGEGNITAKIQ